MDTFIKKSYNVTKVGNVIIEVASFSSKRRCCFKQSGGLKHEYPCISDATERSEIMFKSFRYVILLVFISLAAASHSQSSKPEKIPEYDRDLFGEWPDTDRDCQNMRHELLQNLSTAPVRFSENTCMVTRGRWLDPYTGKIFLESRLLDIDHLVPLKYSWDRGAHAWTSIKRRQFANDPINLFAVDKSVNRQKSAYGPSEWLPPNIKFRCQYILRFQRVVKLYGLTQGSTELNLIEQARQKYCS